MQVMKQQLELDMEQQTVSIMGKEYVKAVYHPAYLLICRIHHEKRWAGGSTSWNQDCQEISITLDMKMTPPLWQKSYWKPRVRKPMEALHAVPLPRAQDRQERVEGKLKGILENIKHRYKSLIPLNVVRSSNSYTN